MKSRRSHAFTLIELLIVVAIIAILALIAVPNFLEAQTRAKVSRSKSDLRSLAVAVEAYRVDGIEWPFVPYYHPQGEDVIVRAHNWPWEYGKWFILTTPIAYITSIPRDAFRKDWNEQWGIWHDYFRVWNLSEHSSSSHWGAPSTLYLKKNGVVILMSSCGPDGVEDVADGTAAGGMAHSGGVVPYDPTNGTVSFGDIYYGLPGVGFDVYQKAQP